MGMSGGSEFVPVFMGNHSGYAVKCGKFDGKGWLKDDA